MQAHKKDKTIDFNFFNDGESTKIKSKNKIADNIKSIIKSSCLILSLYISINMLGMVAGVLDVGLKDVENIMKKQHIALIDSINTHNEKKVKYIAYTLTTMENIESDIFLAEQVVKIMQDDKFSQSLKKEIKDIFLNAKSNNMSYYANKINETTFSCGKDLIICNSLENDMKMELTKDFKNKQIVFDNYRQAILAITNK